MQQENISEYIKQLLEDQNFYNLMIEKEIAIWSKLHTDTERLNRIEEAQKAAELLRLNRDKPSLQSLFVKHGLEPNSGLSLCCGEGRAEREFLKKGICKMFHGIDIAVGSLEEAERFAEQEGLPISYCQGDLNKISLKESSYDLVVAQTCLHHILRLEHLIGEIHKTLKPGGILFVLDYVGEPRFQWLDLRMNIANEILALLPEKLRYDSVNKKIIDKVERKPHRTLAAPFEAIRSDEIVPTLLRYFEVLEYFEFDSILNLVCPLGTLINYVQSNESRIIFEIIFFLDRLLIRNKILPPCGALLLLKKV